MNTDLCNQNGKIKLSVLVPVYKEGENLKIMLRILKATLEIPHEVLVVCDSLDDDSIPVVEAMRKDYACLRSIYNRRGRGVANAIKSGISSATGKYILIIAADDIGPVLAVDDMVALMDQGCDLVSATRYAYQGRVYGGSHISRFLSRWANRFFHMLVRFSLTDSTVGIKMFKRSVFEALNLESRPVGWVIAFELAIKAQRMGLRLGEVPIISINRFYGGKSSFKPGPWIIEYSKWFWWGLKQSYHRGRSKGEKVVLKVPKELILERNKQ